MLLFRTRISSQTGFRPRRSRFSSDAPENPPKKLALVSPYFPMFHRPLACLAPAQQNRTEQNSTEHRGTEQNRTARRRSTDHGGTGQDSTEQNRTAHGIASQTTTEQRRTEQRITEQNRPSQNSTAQIRKALGIAAQSRTAQKRTERHGASPNRTVQNGAERQMQTQKISNKLNADVESVAPEASMRSQKDSCKLRKTHALRRLI